MTDAGPAPATVAEVAAPRRRLVVLAIVVALVTAGALAAATMFGAPRRQVETGIVVAVEATSLTSVQGFSIRTTDGRTLDFQVGTLENASTFPVGHLSVHKVGFEPVRVTFIARDGGNVAVRIEDAP